MERMDEIIKNASGFDYAPVKTKSGKGLKMIHCFGCKKRHAVLFRHSNGGGDIIRCACGYKKRMAPVKVVTPAQCLGTTAKGERCKNKPMKGSCMCAIHSNITVDP